MRACLIPNLALRSVPTASNLPPALAGPVFGPENGVDPDGKSACSSTYAAPKRAFSPHAWIQRLRINERTESCVRDGTLFFAALLTCTREAEHHPPQASKMMLARLSRTIAQRARPLTARTFAAPAPKMFDYDTIVKSLSVADAIETVEDAFCKLAEGKVDVPMPMHITIDETDSAGPGDCHVKGGYVSGAATWTVKVASVSFYKSGGPPGGGVFVVMNAVTGQPCGIFQENRFMTDLRTGAWPRPFKY